SIGGGQLEFAATAKARRLAGGRPVTEILNLGPTLAQCCGGRVRLLYEPLAAADQEWLAAWGAAAAGRLPVTRIDPGSRLILDAEGSVPGATPPETRGQARAMLHGGSGIRFIELPGDASYLLQAPEQQCDRVVLFGAGHVGQALIRCLAPLGYDITWVDS